MSQRIERWNAGPWGRPGILTVCCLGAAALAGGCSERGAAAEPTAAENAGGAEGATGAGSAHAADATRSAAGSASGTHGGTLADASLPVVEAGRRAAGQSAAQRWVAEHRNPQNAFEAIMAEVEAEALELMERLMAGETLTPGELLDVMSIQQKLRWAADEDFDGELSAEELARLTEASRMLEPTEHPYLAEHFDTDGDGVVSDAERQAGQERMQQAGMNAIKPFLDRAALVAWDADGDGHLTEAEREAALSREEMMLYDGNQDGVLDENERIGAMFMTSGEFLAALQNPEPEVAMPEPPQMNIDWEQYDRDGEPGLSAEEIAAMQEDARDEMEEWARQWEQSQMRRDVSIYDLDGDGRLSLDEREKGLQARQLAARKRIFMAQYDGDKNGRIEPAELQQFMAWHQAGAPRADADLDGRVTPADLQLMLNIVRRQ